MQDQKKTIISGLIVGCLILALGVGVYYAQNLNKAQTVKTQAAPVSQIESFLPKPGSKISSVTDIQAKAKYPGDLKNLLAVFKVGEFQSEQLIIERLDKDNVLIKGKLDSTRYPNGSHNLTIYLYSTESGKTSLIGSSQYSISISN